MLELAAVKPAEDQAAGGKSGQPFKGTREAKPVPHLRKVGADVGSSVDGEGGEGGAGGAGGEGGEGGEGGAAAEAAAATQAERAAVLGSLDALEQARHRGRI